jgi:hypothetical protein
MRTKEVTPPNLLAVMLFVAAITMAEGVATTQAQEPTVADPPPSS